MKKWILLIASFCTVLFFTSFVSAKPKPPKKCPSVSAIQAVGVSQNAVQDNTGEWYTGRAKQKYDTKTFWTFAIGKITAVDKTDAFNKATAALQTLTFSKGPFAGPMEKWICLYNTAQGYAAAAITPPLGNKDKPLPFLVK